MSVQGKQTEVYCMFCTGRFNLTGSTQSFRFALTESVGLAVGKTSFAGGRQHQPYKFQKVSSANVLKIYHVLCDHHERAIRRAPFQESSASRLAQNQPRSMCPCARESEASFAQNSPALSHPDNGRPQVRKISLPSLVRESNAPVTGQEACGNGIVAKDWPTASRVKAPARMREGKDLRIWLFTALRISGSSIRGK